MKTKFRFIFTSIGAFGVCTLFFYAGYLQERSKRKLIANQIAANQIHNNKGKVFKTDFNTTSNDLKYKELDAKINLQGYNNIVVDPKIRILCSDYPTQLTGDQLVNSSNTPSEEEAISASGILDIGGCYTPKHCKAQQKVAMVIPYKNRKQHLLTMLQHLHPILKRQNTHYCVFVAEQHDNGTFNKARIMNAAFSEINKNWESINENKKRPFDCFIFHDVDMLLENDKNMYQCESMPKHLSPAIDKFNYTTGYGTKYGGVTAIRKEQYILVNGHSNRFWGWGGEDNDMEKRIERSGLSILSVDERLGRYKMIHHNHPWWFSPLTGIGSFFRAKTDKIIDSSEGKDEKVYDTTGLSDMEYTLIESNIHKLWIKLTLEIRTEVIDNITVHLTQYGGNDVVIKKQSDKDISSANDNQPSHDYIQFRSKTVNRTRSLGDKRYTKTYYSLDDAKKECDNLQHACRSIVEQIKGRYSLRSTSFVQECSLHYKMGLSEQRDIFEKSFSRNVFVKESSGNPDFIQFFKEPYIIQGDEQSGTVPTLHIEMNLRIFHDSSFRFLIKLQCMTSHRAVMDQRLDNGVIQKTWWDSMGKIQQSKIMLVDLSDHSRLEKYLVQDDIHSKVYRIKSPLVGLLRIPGCYIVKAELVEEESDSVVMVWAFWVELKAQTKEIGEKMKENELKKSVAAGMKFNYFISQRKVLLDK